MFTQLSRCTDFNEIWHINTSVLEEGHRLLFTAITEIHADGAPGESKSYRMIENIK